MKKMIGHLFYSPWIFASELVFSIIIISLCLVIYFKTKEAFKLTKHKGIYYFRKTFLFFAFAYFFRLISLITFLLYSQAGIRPEPSLFMPLSLIFISFVSTMAIIYLFLSLSWRALGVRHIELFSTLLALIISILAFLSREPWILISCQATLLLLTFVLSLNLHKQSKKSSKLFVIYLLLFVFWIVGLSSLSARRPIPHEFALISQILSFVIFATIFYKVHKWIK